MTREGCDWFEGRCSVLQRVAFFDALSTASDFLLVFVVMFAGIT